MEVEHQEIANFLEAYPPFSDLPAKALNKLASHVEVFIGLIYFLTTLGFVYGVNETLQARGYINELSNFDSLSSYQIQNFDTKRDVRYGEGKLGNFYTCLNAYKPLSWASPKKGAASTVKILIGNSYLLSTRVAEGSVYRFTLARLRHPQN
ncbi:hypothetical protein [Pseudoalteromonas sp. S16_S37]|uniref:hypothetical protein n=1 Tax=Pseudoalteromonas sp. S16_S37 TaxID=2720228 RepID=UPI001680BF0E|nr:hypothetical protein [Pseudoalteromonas sp. S16_S37]MBD1583244.1 hypothetical protein [Pseudoalteromonas sp. S16_S37]